MRLVQLSDIHFGGENKEAVEASRAWIAARIIRCQPTLKPSRVRKSPDSATISGRANGVARPSQIDWRWRFRMRTARRRPGVQRVMLSLLPLRRLDRMPSFSRWVSARVKTSIERRRHW